MAVHALHSHSSAGWCVISKGQSDVRFNITTNKWLFIDKINEHLVFEHIYKSHYFAIEGKIFLIRTLKDKHKLMLIKTRNS